MRSGHTARQAGSRRPGRPPRGNRRAPAKDAAAASRGGGGGGGGGGLGPRLVLGGHHGVINERRPHRAPGGQPQAGPATAGNPRLAVEGAGGVVGGRQPGVLDQRGGAAIATRVAG